MIADSIRTFRVVETSGAPVYYFPPENVKTEVLIPTEHWTLCEWKGVAVHYDIKIGKRIASKAAWSMPDPLTDLGEGYERLEGYVAFYPARVDACILNGEAARPQPGGYYGGWVTKAIVGPLKGVDGSENW